jgi:hypothetical protein
MQGFRLVDDGRPDVPGVGPDRELLGDRGLERIPFVEADHIGLIFNRRIHGGRRPTPSRFRTRVITDGVAPSLHADYKHTTIKQYNNGRWCPAVRPPCTAGRSHPHDNVPTQRSTSVSRAALTRVSLIVYVETRRGP